MILKPTLSLLLVWTTFFAVFPHAIVRATPNQNNDETASEPEPGLRFRLREGTEVVETPPAVRAPADARSLSEVETKELLSRLPQLKSDPSDTVAFKLRESSVPPPRAGNTIQAAFTSLAARVPPPTATKAPLEITRFAPEGEVEIAPNLSITFSQPMVGVSSQSEAAAYVPVILAPQPKGTWRWLGTQTLMFQPDAEGGRMPMATDYEVTIPAGTKSALGNTLRKTKTFNFTTPPLSLNRSYPSGESNTRDSLMFLEFDQRIDAKGVLEHLKLEPGIDLRAATAEEIAGDEAIGELIKEAQEGRWIVVRAVSANGATKDALPSDTMIKVVVAPGAPSAEGPLPTDIEQSFSFKTYGPLTVVKSECGNQNICVPFARLELTLSNQLHSDTKPAQVKITPEIADLKINFAGNRIQIEGIKSSNTTYKVTLDPHLKDVFDQPLSGENTFTFRVNPNTATLFSVGGDFRVLDPAGPRAFSVYSTHYRQLRVELYKVTTADWPQFQAYRNERRNNPKSGTKPPGQLVFQKVVDIKADQDQLTETRIDLSPALDDKGYGQVFAHVEPVDNKEERSGPVMIYGTQQLAEGWLQSTEIGLDAFVDKDQIVAWTNSLKDGRPLGGVEITVTPDDLTGSSASNGLALLPFKDPSKPVGKEPPLIVARRGQDLAILSLQHSPYLYGSYQSGYTWSWRQNESRVSLAWYVFDDRKLYRPGEEVNIKGWIRKIDRTPTGSTGLYTPEPNELLHYVLKDGSDKEILKGSVKLNSLAGFNVKVKLPQTMTLGGAVVKFQFGEEGSEEKTSEYDSDDDSDYDHYFEVQEFRRPEFEITTRASEAPHFVGLSATVTTVASYYSGGPLANTDVDWTVVSAAANYTPPNRDDFIFGKFYAWWRSDSEETLPKEQTFKGRTNGEGKHTLRIDFDGVTPARPSSVSASARVQDVNRQTIESTTTLLVHPADVYVGLKTPRSFVQKGEPLDTKTIVTDLDGKALAGRAVSLRLVRLESVYENGEWTKQERDVQEQTITSGPDAVSVRFQTSQGGMYSLTARVRDDRERLNETELSLWVAGGKLPPNREVTMEKVELIPDHRTYAGNDVAEILVQSPFAPAEGVMTIRRSGLLRTERFTMNESSHTLRVPIEEAMTPNVQVQVDLVGASMRVDDQGNELANVPKRAAFASGEIRLDIPPAMRRLTVTATPRETVLEPGAETVVDVQVKDLGGQGVAGTDTAVVVVDESVLALSDYKLSDPLSSFYAPREASVNDFHLREKITLANEEDLKPLAPVGEGFIEVRQIVSLPINGRNAQRLQTFFLYDQTMNSATEMVTVTSSASTEIAIRQNFNALAVFAASVATDASGRAQVKVKLPDNLTRYRVMAISVAGGRLAGWGAASVTARKQLMARPSAPRFLNYGDTAELPVVLQNQTDQALSVSVAVRATNAQLTDGAGRGVNVPANDRVEVRFPVRSVQPGTARFQVIAASSLKTDAAEVSLPVYTPATTEAFATYGVIDKGSIAQPVQAPADAIPAFGGLEVTTASTQLQELTDAAIYLVNYPYGCTEQTASRVMAIAALKDVLTAFKSKDLPSPESLRYSVEQDLKYLNSLQNEDGGFGFWRRGEPSFPYVSVHVAHALVRAKGKGFAVPETTLESAQQYLDEIEKNIPEEYSVESRRAIQAYALYVCGLMGNTDGEKARRLIADEGGVGKFSLEALGWLLPVLSADPAGTKETEAIRRYLNNHVTETAGAAHFADSYSDGAYTTLQSNRRADGVVLDALVGDQPQSDLIPKLVRGLLSGRTHGRWTNTQENAFILLALARYFNSYERTAPNFVARVWLGSGFAGEQVFKGRTADRQQLNLPMSELFAQTARASANLTIGKEGEGRLYYRIGARYAPSSLKLAAADYGFQIERKYEAIDNPDDVRREVDGTWTIKAGARVRVKVTMSNPARRYHVALVDPLPAGLEPLNPELATTERLPAESDEEDMIHSGGGIYEYHNWRRTWYEHQNLRDERVEAFCSLLWEGVHEYTYVARATTPGLFIVPPSKAEEMYAPETFGRGSSDRVRVK